MALTKIKTESQHIKVYNLNRTILLCTFTKWDAFTPKGLQQ